MITSYSNTSYISAKALTLTLQEVIQAAGGFGAWTALPEIIGMRFWGLECLLDG